MRIIKVDQYCKCPFGQMYASECWHCLAKNKRNFIDPKIVQDWCPLEKTQSTKQKENSESPSTDAQQLQAVIADLSYVDSVIKEYGVSAGSKCHEMVARSVSRLTDMQ